MKANFGEMPSGQKKKPAKLDGSDFNFEEVLARARDMAKNRKRNEEPDPQSELQGDTIEQW